jgi:retron-type reverse transcriptase
LDPSSGAKRRPVFNLESVLSPLLANIYIHRLFKAWKEFDLETKLKARIINYADDLVILCRGRAEEALAWLRWITERLGLSLNEAKTRVCDAHRETLSVLIQKGAT